MRAILKSIDTNSHVSFEDYSPEDEACFSLWLTIQVGPEGREGAHLFQILVCTPYWLQREYEPGGAAWGRHMLILTRYDRERIRSKILEYVAECTGDSFWEVAQKIARIGAWEYEDYKTLAIDSQNHS